MTQQNKKQSWEESFDKEFTKFTPAGRIHFRWGIKPQDYKDFITQLLASRDRELVERIEKIRKRFRCGACDGAKAEHTQACQCLQTLSASDSESIK
jgi:hypothetical protein